MAKRSSSLTVYRLRDEVVEDLGDVVDTSKGPTIYDLTSRFRFRARLFVAPPEVRTPPWLRFLEVGFGKLSRIPDSVNNSAVLVTKLKVGKKDCHFAFTFGFGRFLLRPGCYERNYGLRVALNAVYPRRGQGQQFDPNRLRTVDSKTVASNTLRTRRQADRYTVFESFDVDIQRDLLMGLTGTPHDEKLWGSRITGSDAVHVSRPVSFDQLGELCEQIETFSRNVPPQFSWVDKIFVVRDSTIVDNLKGQIVEMIRDGIVKDLELAPPELVDWGGIDRFSFSFDAENRFDELDITRYVDSLMRKGKLTSLRIEHLTTTHRLDAFDPHDTRINNWTIFNCLSGELKQGSKTYLLSEGEFFEVSGDYLDQLQLAMRSLSEMAGALPRSNHKESEGAYNRRVAASSRDLLLLDRDTVRLTSRTTPIEICDILTTDREFVHVKRKLNSSSLSHLFSQGLVSADLLLMSDQFRRAVRQRVAARERRRRLSGRFSAMFPRNEGITTSRFTVVFGIIARWKGRSLAEALPFFSKVNLRRCAQDLKRMGYQVAYARIPTD